MVNWKVYIAIKLFFSDLVRTENGFKFNMTTITHEMVYNLDEKGMRTTIVRIIQVRVCFVTSWQCGKVLNN